MMRVAPFLQSLSMEYERIRLAADAGFWPAAARAVLEFASRHGAAGRELQSLTWIVPTGAHAALARATLGSVLGGVAFIPPRIAPLAAWLGRPLRSGTATHAALFNALRASPWVRSSFSTQPAALWGLAEDIALLSDELTLAALAEPQAYGERLQQSLARHYRRRAARALQPQAQLVLQLWQAQRGSDDGAAGGAMDELERRAQSGGGPLVYLAGAGGAALAAWEEHFLRRYAEHAPVLLLEAEVAQALMDRPLLAVAWPELTGENRDVPLAARADAVRAGAVAPRLAILPAATLEEEAAAVASQVLAWLREGVARIALVALDRLTARRVRALLERAQVIVRDETGWKLSTTSAAAAVMRWLDVVADDLYWRDLLDWSKSSFTLYGYAGKPEVVSVFEQAIRGGGALQGVRAMRRALLDVDAGDSGAVELLDLIDREARAARNAGPGLADHARTLQRSLRTLGMRPALAVDPVGNAVLDEIDALQVELEGIGGRASLAEFRTALAARFEDAAFIDHQVESPVSMMSLAATWLRPYDAALLIGADAAHLPAAPAERLFLPNSVRAELGLSTGESQQHAQAMVLASLLAATPQVVATWRTRMGDEPNTVSPLLERLQFASARACGDELTRSISAATRSVEPRTLQRPTPSCPELLPPRVSASQAQSLVNCAYQFYARALLGLSEVEDVIEVPDKRDFGVALHRILWRFHRAWAAADFSQLEARALQDDLARHAQAVFDPLIERAPALLAFRHRFEGLIPGYVVWLQQHARAGWRWAAGEERHEQRVELASGRTVELIGRIDRIDSIDRGSEVGSLVIDYKARSADQLRNAVRQPGEDVQLPFYGLLLGAPLEAAAYLAFERRTDESSGVVEVRANEPFDVEVQRVGERLRADLQRVAAGAPLPAFGIAAVCKYCEMRGLCRRDYWEHSDGEHSDAERDAADAAGISAGPE
jgi:ATP-dependent helicase/nuclease subunit B